MYYLTTLLLMIGFLSTPALAQETPTPEATEEAAPAEDAGDAAEAPTADAEDAPEGDEAVEDAPEGDEEAPEAAEGDEAAPDEAEAPKAPETDEEAIQTALSIVDALKGGQWPLAIGLLLSLLVYGVNRFALKEKFDEKVTPWISFGVGVAGATGTGLVMGTSIFEALTAGVIAGTVAIGGWEMLLKHIGKPKAEDAPAEETPES
jgi:uncharacterized membrane protein